MPPCWPTQMRPVESRDPQISQWSPGSSSHVHVAPASSVRPIIRPAPPAIAESASTAMMKLETWASRCAVQRPAAGGLGAVLAELLPARLIERGLRERVLAAARAAFVELGVHRTRARTGVLVYVSVRERRVELVCDVAVVDKVAGLERLAAAL